MNANHDLPLQSLLPAVYRLRDAHHGATLSEVLSVLGEQVQIVGRNMDELYRDMFIETCQPWVVPYIGELVGIRPTSVEFNEAGPRRVLANRLLFPRREVADAIRFETRKGTLAVLEDLAQTVTGWPARAVEYYAQVSTFQSSQHLDPVMGGTVDVRKPEVLERAATPFNTLAHLVDARTLTQPSPRMFAYRGLFHPKHVGLLVWRLGLYSLSRGAARCVCSKTVDGQELRLYTFDSFGLATPLAIKPIEVTDETRIAGEQNVPGPLTLRAFTNEDGSVSELDYGQDKSVEVWEQNVTPDPDTTTCFGQAEKRGEPTVVSASRIKPMDLSWLLHGCCSDGDGDNTCLTRRDLVETLGSRIGIDPEHGLLAVAGNPETLQNARLLVTYHYTSSADMGGGDYDRAGEPTRYSLNTQLRRVRSDETDPEGTLFTDEVDFAAPAAKNDCGQPGASHLVVEIADNDTYCLGTQRIVIGSGGHLEIRAAKRRRPTIELCDAGACDPALTIEMTYGARLTLDGIRVAGGKIAIVQKLTFSELEAHGISVKATIVDAGQNVEFEVTQDAANSRKRVLTRILKQGTCASPTKIWESDDNAFALTSFYDNEASRLFFSLNDCRPRGVLPLPQSNTPARVNIRHCALLPATPTSECNSFSGNKPMPLDFRIEDGRLAIDHSVTGQLVVTGIHQHRPARVSIADSIVDGQAADCELAIGGATGCILRVSRSTILGRTHVQELDCAADSIFTRDMEVRRQQLGGLRFCYVPPKTIAVDEDGRSVPTWKTPQQYYCQPSQAYERSRLTDCGNITADPPTMPWELIEPRFTSLRYSNPGYCQLTLDCPREISQGAEDGSEMGVFHDLFQPHRVSSLSRQLEEFTPLSLESSLIFVN